MNAFISTLIHGFAALGVLLVSAIAALIVMLLMNQQLDAKALRALVLTETEREWLAARRKLADEPAPAQKAATVPTGGMTQDELVAHIADVANASHASQLVAKLKQQQQALDERQVWMDQQWSDLQLAKAGLERLGRQLGEQERKLAEQARQQEQERTRWAAAQVEEAGRIQVMGAVEKARYQDQAKLFEAMKDNAWTSLKRFPARDIARYLALMSEKKAARMLVLAQQDEETPGIAVAIHQEMLRLDLDRATGDQVERLAMLYSFMPAPQILSYLKSSSAEEVADLMRAMAAKGQVKKRAELLEALRTEDAKRELEVRRLLEQGGVAGGAGGAPGGGTAANP